MALHDRFVRVCGRCGSPVKVKANIVCPEHGKLEVLAVLTLSEWLLNQRTGDDAEDYLRGYADVVRYLDGGPRP